MLSFSSTALANVLFAAKMSFRDIGFILKKEGLDPGITTIEDNDKNNKKSSNEKVTQAYKLFSEGKSLIEADIIVE